MAIKPFTFEPLVEFEWYREDLEKLIGHYIPGMSYNCTLEPRHDMLRGMCDQWEKEGKIRKKGLSPDQKFVTVEVNDGNTT
jgi:hypothetical protein